MDTPINVGYSRRMTSDVTPLAPAAQTTYSKSGRVGRAWAHAWDLMTQAGDEYLEAIQLAERSAAISDLSPKTMQAVFSRQCKAGLLEKRIETVPGTRGPRPRVYYRTPRS